MTDATGKLAELAALLDRGLLSREEFEEQKAVILAASRRDSSAGSGGDDRLGAGTTVGSYEVLGRIGEGGMATVYKVRHLALHSVHAMKVLNPELARDNTIRERFLSEGRIQANLRHPNINRVTDLVAEPGVAGLVAEFVDGRDMASWIEEHGGTTDPDRIREVFIPVAEALATAHDAGVIHRDVKPSNILLSTAPDGRLQPTVLDFGIARVVGDGPGRRKSATRTGAQIGTIAYMSPEQIKGARDLDLRTDVFSLAATLYEFVTGSPPFDGDTDFEIMTGITGGLHRSTAALVPGLEPGIVAGLDSSLSPEREQRPESCRAFARLLRAGRTAAPVRSVGEEAAVPALVQSGSAALDAQGRVGGAEREGGGELTVGTTGSDVEPGESPDPLAREPGPRVGPKVEVIEVDPTGRPGTQANLQVAIANAPVCAEIHLHPGTYEGCVTLENQVHLRGLGEVAIVGRGTAALRFGCRTGSVKNVTLRREPAPAGDDIDRFGAALYLEGDITVEGCTIVGDTEGVCIRSGAPTLERCDITTSSEHMGTGVSVVSGSPTLIANVIHDNNFTGVSISAGCGGVYRQNLCERNSTGFWVSRTATPLLQANTAHGGLWGLRWPTGRALLGSGNQFVGGNRYPPDFSQDAEYREYVSAGAIAGVALPLVHWAVAAGLNSGDLGDPPGLTEAALSWTPLWAYITVLLGSSLTAFDDSITGGLRLARIVLFMLTFHAAAQGVRMLAVWLCTFL